MLATLIGSQRGRRSKGATKRPHITLSTAAAINMSLKSAPTAFKCRFRRKAVKRTCRISKMRLRKCAKISTISAIARATPARTLKWREAQMRPVRSGQVRPRSPLLRKRRSSRPASSQPHFRPSHRREPTAGGRKSRQYKRRQSCSEWAREMPTPRSALSLRANSP